LERHHHFVADSTNRHVTTRRGLSHLCRSVGVAPVIWPARRDAETIRLTVSTNVTTRRRSDAGHA
jgi:hypothetical protein